MILVGKCVNVELMPMPMLKLENESRKKRYMKLQKNFHFIKVLIYIVGGTVYYKILELEHLFTFLLSGK